MFMDPDLTLRVVTLNSRRSVETDILLVCHWQAGLPLPSLNSLFSAVWVLSAFSQSFDIPSIFSDVFELGQMAQNITFHKILCHLSIIYIKIKYVQVANDAGRLRREIIKFLVFW